MEDFFSFLFVILGIWGVRAWFGSLTGGNAKAADSQQMVPFEIRLSKTHLGDDGEGPLAIDIEGRGLFPVDRPTEVTIVSSVLDTTDDQPKPVLARYENWQEPSSPAYQHAINGGTWSPDYGLPNWAPFGRVIPEILRAPCSGRRELTIITRIVDARNPPSIEFGFCDGDHPGFLWSRSLLTAHYFENKDKGYEEESEARREAQAITIKIAVAVSMSDGSLDDTEGATIRDWIVKSIAPFSDVRREEMKELYNASFRDAYEQAKAGLLSLTDLTDRMNVLDEQSEKYEAVELCFDVLSADGVAHPKELKMIQGVAEALELDYDQIQEMRDQRIIELDPGTSRDLDAEQLLGIEPDWDRKRIRRHILTEFQKWNNRINVLPEGTERENAQRMLDLLAEAKKKYADPSSD